MHTISFQTFFVWAFKIVVDTCYCYISYEMTGQVLWFQVQMNSYSTNWNTPYKSLIATAGEFQKCNEDILEERYAKTFCFKLGKNVTETYGMLLTAFWPSCMNRVSVFEWHKRFKEGRESVRDDERCGRSKGVNTPEMIGKRVRVRVRVPMLRF